MCNVLLSINFYFANVKSILNKFFCQLYFDMDHLLIALYVRKCKGGYIAFILSIMQMKVACSF